MKGFVLCKRGIIEKIIDKINVAREGSIRPVWFKPYGQRMIADRKARCNSFVNSDVVLSPKYTELIEFTVKTAKDCVGLKLAI